jgi:predicted TIM-barrel fold metal-dependent hydrolase
LTEAVVVVDAQIHLWTGGEPGPAHRRDPYGIDDALADMAAAGVDASVIVPPPWDPDANALAARAAYLHPDKFAVMGHVAAHDPASAPWFDALREQSGMLGLRVAFSQPATRPGLTEGTADWLWPRAADAEVPIAIFAPGLLDHVRVIAERHPGLRLVIDHMGLVTGARDAEAFEPVLAPLAALAELPNVSLKLSSAPAYSSAPFPYENIDRYLGELVALFGPQRCFWGTDITRLKCTWRQAVTHFSEHLRSLSAEDADWIMGRALCQWLSWPQPLLARSPGEHETSP